MIKIFEKKRENKSIYELLTYDANDKVILTETLRYETATFEHSNKFTYLILYNEEMKPYSEVFSYLNTTIESFSINSRLKALTALRLLYIYQHIISKKIIEFNVTDVNNLKSFLRGLSPAGQALSFELITNRSNETINGYLSVYRNFLTHLNCENSYLFKTIKGKKTSSESDTPHSSERYASSENNTKDQGVIPYYISVFDFQNILYEIRKHFSSCEECMVRLMYENGLRLGEVLGLTFDDITSEVYEGKKKFFVYLRNRVSDNKDQHAKTCMKVNDVKEYNSKGYKKEGYGFQKVEISEILYSKINDYIETYHAYALKNKGYNKFSLADRARKTEPYESDNYYVFLNTLGRPMSYQTWNNRLKAIFNAVNIPIDTGTKEHNLSHRFRHGFAVFNVIYMKTDALQLMVKMRHRNVSTVSVYFRLTITDQIKIKTDFTNQLYEIIPELEL
ncbi:MAG TPA: site-specific integrase [Mobilitalea sp.]|nr:site-specific integrase [Mobilitalea sp.]